MINKTPAANSLSDGITPTCLPSRIREEQISSTYDESRFIMIRGQVTEVAYNVKTTVDTKHNLIIDVKAVNTNDK